MTPGYPKTLAEFVRARREAKKLSLRALATKVNVSAAFLSDLEHGRRFPSDDVRDQIADALDVTRDEMKGVDARVRGELKDWLNANPDVSRLLTEFQQAGRSGEELIAAWRRSSKSKG